jgi:hypothetical protein
VACDAASATEAAQVRDLLLEAAFQCLRDGWRLLPVYRNGGERKPLSKWESSIIPNETQLPGHFQLCTRAGGELAVWLGRTIAHDPRTKQFFTLVCLDIDERKAGAAEAFERLTKEWGVLPETVCDYRDGGGPHHFFWLPADFFDGYVAKSALELAPGVELLARNHLVGLAPSRGSDGGAERRWIIPPNGRASIARLPEAWQARAKALLDKRCPVTPSKPRKKREAASIARRVQPYLAKLPPAVAGERGHDRLYRAACILIHGFGLCVSEAFPYLAAFNDRCEPPFSEAQLLHKLREAEANGDGRGKPRGYLLNEKRTGGQTKGGDRGVRFDDAGLDGEAGDEGEDDRRPGIKVTTEEHEVNDAAVAALANVDLAPNLYQRGPLLVRALRAEGGLNLGVNRTPDTPYISNLPPPVLREMLTCVCRFTNPEGDAIHPPKWCVPAIHARGQWKGVRTLTGIVEAPTMRLDGSILDAPGWDKDTGLLYVPNAAYPPVPDKPSIHDAMIAAEKLHDLVTDFPFPEGDSGRNHEAVWLAAVLTALVRFAIDGPCPLFLFDANTSGAGKGLLVHLVSVLSTGRECSAGAFPDSDEELRK